MSFITLKGWNSTFGRWYIWGPLFIHIACIFGYVVGDHWAAYALVTAVLLTLWIGGYINWRALKRIDHSRKDGHTVGICDNCVPICYDGGAPLDLSDWYGKKTKQSRVFASEWLSSCPIDEYKRAVAEHAEYLKHKKFRNYPKP